MHPDRSTQTRRSTSALELVARHQLSISTLAISCHRLSCSSIVISGRRKTRSPQETKRLQDLHTQFHISLAKYRARAERSHPVSSSTLSYFQSL
ncbi:unnamed protein product [Rhodiola kirilowii]